MINVARLFGDCTDRECSVQSVAFSVTESVCLTALLCVQEEGSEKEERVMQRVSTIAINMHLKWQVLNIFMVASLPFNSVD